MGKHFISKKNNPHILKFTRLHHRFPSILEKRSAMCPENRLFLTSLPRSYSGHALPKQQSAEENKRNHVQRIVRRFRLPLIHSPRFYLALIVPHDHQRQQKGRNLDTRSTFPRFHVSTYSWDCRRRPNTNRPNHRRVRSKDSQ